MVRLIFLSQREKSVEVYKAACILSKTKYLLKDFLKNYPKKEIDIKNFIRKWRPKESFILSEIERIYNPWKEGEILIGFFPKREIFWKLPEEDQKCHTFGLENKAYIILFPTLERQGFSLKILIHELFHVNDVLREKFGKVENKKHQWFEEKSQEIFKKYF